MPESGIMANCITLESIVIAPTAISPPYLRREELKHTDIILSLDCITNAARPSAMHGRISLKSILILSRLSLSMLFPFIRKCSTHMQDMPCDIMVASAAPETPISNTNMNSGSSTMLATAPMSTVYMPVFAKPCAVMKAFIPSVSCTNMVPTAYMFM